MQLRQRPESAWFKSYFKKRWFFAKTGFSQPRESTCSARLRHLDQSGPGTTCLIPYYKFSESYTGTHAVVFSQLHFPSSKKGRKRRLFRPKFQIFEHPIHKKKTKNSAMASIGSTLARSMCLINKNARPKELCSRCPSCVLHFYERWRRAANSN